MPRFRYRALRPSGGEVAGELTAADERDAAAQLQAVGNYPIEIAAPAAFGFRLRLPRPRLPARELVLFTRQLAVLVGGGGRAGRARLAGDLLAAVNRGDSLSRACAEHPALPPLYATVIAAGELRGD